jgi:hypothetical protein
MYDGRCLFDQYRMAPAAPDIAEAGNQKSSNLFGDFRLQLGGPVFKAAFSRYPAISLGFARHRLIPPRVVAIWSRNQTKPLRDRSLCARKRTIPNSDV